MSKSQSKSAVSAEVLMPKLRQLRRDKELLESQISEVQGELIKAAEAAGNDAVVWVDESGEPQSSPIKQSSRGVIIAAKLQKLVDPKIWKQISYEMVDKEALNILIEAGKVPLSAKEKATVVTPGKKYVQ